MTGYRFPTDVVTRLTKEETNKRKEDVLFGLCPATFRVSFFSIWSILSLTERLADFLPKLLTSDDRARRELAAAKTPIGRLWGWKGGATAGPNNNRNKKRVVVAFLCSCCCCCRSSTYRCLYKLTWTIRMNGGGNFYRRLFFSVIDFVMADGPRT